MPPLRFLVLLLGLTAGLRAADAIQVAGVIAMGQGRAMVRLVNATTGIAAWVSVGDTFSGYRVQSYNASSDGRSDSVTLSGNGPTLRLSLAVPKIRSSGARGGATTTAIAIPPGTGAQPATPMIPGAAEPAAAPPPPPPAPAGN
jgi:hypothetical protein